MRLNTNLVQNLTAWEQKTLSSEAELVKAEEQYRTETSRLEKRVRDLMQEMESSEKLREEVASSSSSKTFSSKKHG